MTAGSYCYIGPQGIVHGTTVSIGFYNLESGIVSQTAEVSVAQAISPIAFHFCVARSVCLSVCLLLCRLSSVTFVYPA